MTRFSFGLTLKDLVRVGVQQPYILVRPWAGPYTLVRPGTDTGLFVTEIFNHEEGKRFEDALKQHDVDFMKWVHSDD